MGIPNQHRPCNRFKVKRIPATSCATSLSLCALAILIVNLSVPVHAQQELSLPRNSWPYRFDAFQYLLQQNGLRVEPERKVVFESAPTSVVVLLGKCELFNLNEIDQLHEFVTHGGTLVIAPDDRFNATKLGSVFPGPVLTNVRSDQFQEYRDCLIISKIAKENFLSAGLESLICNRSGWIHSKPSELEWSDLCWLPDNCFPTTSRGKPVISLGEHRATGGAIILIADPSLLSNGMLWFGDNSDLAVALAGFLTRDRTNLHFEVHRKSQAFVQLEEIERLPTDNLPADPLRPKWDTLLQVANRALQESSDPRTSNQQLRSQPRKFRPRDYIATIWSMLGLIVLTTVLLKLFNRPTSFASFLPKRRMKTGRELVRASRPIERQNKIAAEALAREFARRWTGDHHPSEWRACLDQLRETNHSELTINEIAKIESILALALFGAKNTMSTKELHTLGNDIQSLLLRFVPPGKMDGPSHFST